MSSSRICNSLRENNNDLKDCKQLLDQIHHALTDELPNHSFCPIVAAEPMSDPVVTLDGHSYQRDSIKRWFAKRITSPMTGLELPNATLIPNIALRNMIEEHLAGRSERRRMALIATVTSLDPEVAIQLTEQVSNQYKEELKYIDDKAAGKDKRQQIAILDTETERLKAELRKRNEAITERVLLLNTELKKKQEEELEKSRTEVFRTQKSFECKIAQLETQVQLAAQENEFLRCHVAALQGNPEAEYKLALIFEEGRGVKRDEDEAKIWYEKAANHQHANAQYRLGRYHFDYIYRRGNEASQAVIWYHRAADQDHPLAQFQLALCLQFGKGIFKDEKKAHELLERAATQKCTRAQSHLAYCYEYGESGVPKDEKKAVFWYSQAAKESRDAKYRLGYFHETGRGGLAQDAKRAVAYYKEATAEFNLDAKLALARCYELGIGIDRDIDLAVKHYQAVIKYSNHCALVKAAEEAIRRLNVRSVNLSNSH